MHCRVMQFCTPLLQEAAYELWLKSQKIALHLKCASFLEWHAHKCKCCGEGDFIPFHRYAVEGMLFNIDPEEHKTVHLKDNMLNEAVHALVSDTLIKLLIYGMEGKADFLTGTGSSRAGATVNLIWILFIDQLQ